MWEGSWLALEKAYAEGRVMSIGVSNFDAALLATFSDRFTVRPHIVQNWSEPVGGSHRHSLQTHPAHLTK